MHYSELYIYWCINIIICFFLLKKQILVAKKFLIVLELWV